MTTCLRCLYLLLALLLPGTALAHAGEDHAKAGTTPAAAPPAADGEGDGAPRRLADGRVFVPKPAQRRFGLRTQRAVVGEHAAIVELNGRVIADPGSAGLVQALQGGRIIAAAGGIPALGQRVARGEVLAWVEPQVTPLERSARAGELAQVRAQLALAESRMARLAQLDGVVPGRDIEAARIERDGLQTRAAALALGVDAREALRAPVSGIVAASEAAPGQVVAARQTVFEVVDPGRLAVEALAYDLGQVEGAGKATALAGAASVPLAFAGAGRILRDGALAVRFRVLAGGAAEALPPLAINQPLKVYVTTGRTQKGVAVPVEALVRNAAGEAIVWTHPAAEHFVPAPVRSIALDGRRALVVEGLPAGARVVVQGAALLSQVR